MRSTFGGLNTMVRGLYGNQVSLDTVGNNITNAATPGYSRQTVNLTTTKPQTMPGVYGDFKIGTGVDVDSVVRARDTFADRQYWKENSNLNKSTTQQYTLSKIESVFQEPTDTGLQTVISQFYKSWQTLSTNAGEYSNRVVARDTGKQLVNSMNHIKTQLDDLVADNNTQLSLQKDMINQTLDQILSLNKQIVTLEAGSNGWANDLRDQRDLLVDKLSGYMKVDVTELSNGSYSITCGGTTIVDGNSRLEMDVSVHTDPEYNIPIYTLVEKSTGIAMDVKDGSVKGIYDSVDNVKNYLDQMTTMTAFLLNDFNEQHKAGVGLNDETGINFFDPKTTAAGADTDFSTLVYFNGQWSIGGTVTRDTDGNVTNVVGGTHMTKVDILNSLKVNAEFDETGGTDKIAAKASKSTDANGENTASGANASLLGDLLQVTTSTTLGGKSMTGYYTGMIGQLGIQAQEAERNVTNQETIVSQVEGWRQQVCGVNWDEELSNMIKFNKGYSACSRCLTTMDEMLDKLINSTGTVGR